MERIGSQQTSRGTVNGTSGARCVRKSSLVRGRPPKIGGSDWGITPLNPEPGEEGDKGVSSSKSMSGIGQEEGMGPRVRMRYTPRSSGSNRAQGPGMPSSVGGAVGTGRRR